MVRTLTMAQPGTRNNLLNDYAYRVATEFEDTAAAYAALADAATITSAHNAATREGGQPA